MLSSLFLTLTVCALGNAVVPEAVFQDTMIGYHRLIRSMFDLPPLKWNNTLTLSALYRAIECLATGSIPKNGVNVFWSSPTNRDFKQLAHDTMHSWGNEGGYNVEHPDWSCFVDGQVKKPTCKNYSQLLWKNTTSVGCAIAYCDHILSDNVVVCEYYPPGNIIGEIPF